MATTPTAPSPGAPPAPAKAAEEYRGFSLTALAWRRFRRHKLAMYASVVLIILYASAIFSPFLAPYSETRSNRQKYFHPPTKIHFFDENGRLTRPYVYNYRLVDVGRRIYEPVTTTKYPIKFFVKGESYKLFGLIEWDVHLYGVDSPAVIYPLGADHLGRDIVSRMLHGSRKSLFIVIPLIVITVSIGLMYGGISGYFGGRTDNIMMRIGEVVMAVPSFYLLIALAGVMRDVPAQQRFAAVIAILGLVSWAGFARVIRGMVLSLRQQEFVEGALAIGNSHLRTIVRHILPNTISYVVVSITLQVPGFIIAESSLSFLGLGVQEPFSSWGNMLSNATDLTNLTRYPWMLAPGFLIFITVLAWNYVGDGVRDALDPRAVTSGEPR